VYVTEQVAVAPAPVREHVSLENSSVPPGNQWTAPEGVMAVPGDVSFTVAVHVDDAPSAIGDVLKLFTGAGFGQAAVIGEVTRGAPAVRVS